MNANVHDTATMLESPVLSLWSAPEGQKCAATAVDHDSGTDDRFKATMISRKNN